MNLFYFSIHQILEADEVGLFHSMGHDVFSLGINNACGGTQGYRRDIELTARERHLHDIYRQSGGCYSGRKLNQILPHDFIGNFSASIIMHDVDFLEDMWPRLKAKPVIWRTIGQGVDIYEEKLRPLRQQGLHIVRYSPIEKNIDRTLGEEAIIRFGKDPERYCRWSGQETQVLTFGNYFPERYPDELKDWLEIVRGLPCILGGIGNESLNQAIGLVDEKVQEELYRKSRVYLYATGLHIPYTLNFIEAWMTGIPVVVYAPPEKTGKWFEIDSLISHGLNGFVCRSIAEAREVLQLLLDNHEFASKIGGAGRDRARQLFSNERAASEWASVFTEIGA